MNEYYCNNCGKVGHLYNQCKLPITSIGFVVFRIHEKKLQYLMIRRKDTLGFIDFMRGKYSVSDKYYIINMLNQMTVQEKTNLLNKSFSELWTIIWGPEKLSLQYKTEETSSQEKDFACALREFTEETGIQSEHLKNIQNILPFEEIFTGSNYKSYKHKYYVAFCNSIKESNMDKYQQSEVSDMQWFNYDDCLNIIRPYNLEKKRLLNKINHTLNTYRFFYI